MVQVARLRSRELFALTILVMAIATAAASAYVFRVSMALGAFLAGMVVGQSPVSQRRPVQMRCRCGAPVPVSADRDQARDDGDPPTPAS